MNIEDGKDYLVTLSTGSPDWKTSKWRVHAGSKSQALHFALLLHDENHDWSVDMVTISYPASNPSIDLEKFVAGSPDLVSRLDRIYQHGKERLENC